MEKSKDFLNLYKKQLPLTFKRAIQQAVSGEEQVVYSSDFKPRHIEATFSPAFNGRPFHKLASTIFIPSQ
jgi:hypothetical protein